MSAKEGEAALAAIGYSRKADFYVHERSRFPLEFPPAPLAIGDEVLRAWSTVRRRRQVLHVLTPFDSVRDRLASYLFWNDLAGMEQAAHVHLARPRQVSLKRIAAWVAREGQSKKFEVYAARAKHLRAQGRTSRAAGRH
jgi:hypothetical protein